MTKKVLKIITFAAFAGFGFGAWSADLDQLGFPQITSQPVDLSVPAGSNAVFTVQATNGNLSFQWFRNGVAIEGQTNSQLVLQNVGTGDVGSFACNVMQAGGEAVPTRTASLNVFTTLGDQITVFGLPVLSSGSQNTCPGAYAGYVNYTKTISQGWGWAPSTNMTVHTAADGTTRLDTKVVYVGKYGDIGCAQTIVTVPDPAPSPKYRFTIYFPSNVPTNSYPLTLVGFDP